MKNFPTTFPSLPTVLLLLIPVGAATTPLCPAFAPLVVTQAETRGQPPPPVDDPREAQSELSPPQPPPPLPSPDLTPPAPKASRTPARPVRHHHPTANPDHPDPPLQPWIELPSLAPPSTRVRVPFRPPYPSVAFVLPPPPSATSRTPAHANPDKRRREALHDNVPKPHFNYSPTTGRLLPSGPPLCTAPSSHQILQRALLQVSPPQQPPLLFPPGLPPRFPQAVISSQSATQQPPPTTDATTATPDKDRQARTAQVPPETSFLSTREQALLILIAIFLCFLLASPGLRAHIPRLFRTSLHSAILLPLLLMLAYASFEVWIGFQLRLWSPILAKETVIWTIASGAVLLYKGILHANHEPRFFRETASATIAPTVFLTFFMNLTTFGLLTELALQLFLIPVTILSTLAHASSDKGHRAVGRLCDGLASLVVLLWFIYTVIHVQNIWHQLDLHLLVQKLLLPMWLTLGLLPFIYVLSVYVAYQRPLGILKSQTHVFRVRCRAIVAIILTLGLKVRDIAQLQHFWIRKLVDAKTLAAARSAARQFQQSLRDAERAIVEENDRLRRYAGIDGADSGGRRLDRREFKETIKALHWLATCHAGHYRKRNRYDRNLLHLVGDTFTTWGIPKESGITMRVAKGGQRWFAYRRTVSGWCFAIGAAGPPPDQWEYDGPDPPSGFPGEDDCWGTRPFEDAANKNWG